MAYREYDAHNHICEVFESLGAEYQVYRQPSGIETALEVIFTRGNGGRVVVFNAEYDALSGMGHACGHNLIATASIATFIATCETMASLYVDQVGFFICLLGTPVEEGGGGKFLLIKAGACKCVDACFMGHPFPVLLEASDLISSSSCSG